MNAKKNTRTRLVWIWLGLMLIAGCNGAAPQQPAPPIEATPTGAPTASPPEVVQPTAQVEANPPTEAPAEEAPPEQSLPADNQALDPDPPSTPLRLIFIHHSTGEAWLADEHGGLGLALRDNNYFVSDTNYGWGPDGIGDTTDIGHWFIWFRGPNSSTYLDALYTEDAQNSAYARLAENPGGENQIILFKSCFPNSQLGGAPDDPPATGDNPLREQEAASESMTVANAKGLYNDLLSYFASRPDKLFIVVTAPPLSAQDTTPDNAANARAFNNWLITAWLAGYPHQNVFVFDFYNVLTSNGGGADTNDLGQERGNHHRFWNGAVQHVQTANNDFSDYTSAPDDSHPTAAGDRKATDEFIPLLNIAVHCWLGEGGCVR